MDFQFIRDSDLLHPIASFLLAATVALLIGSCIPRKVSSGKGRLVISTALKIYMLRRSVHRVLLPFWVDERFFSSTPALRLEHSAEERVREEELRRKVQEKYRGVQFPEITNHQYGHFSIMGINASTARQAAKHAGVQGHSGFGSIPFEKRRSVDWLMLLTGCLLVYFSSKILFRQITRGVNGLELPLWTASIELQAKHLLFAVQFQPSEQEQMRKDFEAVRHMNPFVDFFEWVRSRRPEFCSGRKYGADYVMHALVSSLLSSDGVQLAKVARTLQQSMTRIGDDPLRRVDDFVEQLQSTGLLFQGIRGTISSNLNTPEYQSRSIYSSPAGVGESRAPYSDLSSALDAKSGEEHSSAPFGGAK